MLNLTPIVLEYNYTWVSASEMPFLVCAWALPVTQNPEVPRGQVQWMRWLRHNYGNIFGQKISTNMYRSVNRCNIVMKKSSSFLYIALRKYKFNIIILKMQLKKWRSKTSIPSQQRSCNGSSEQNLEISVISSATSLNIIR